MLPLWLQVRVEGDKIKAMTVLPSGACLRMHCAQLAQRHRDPLPPPALSRDAEGAGPLALYRALGGQVPAEMAG